MKRWIVWAMLLVPLVASAADFWDGNAALQRGDADFESGLNVASNSFPPGTQITILNEDTGKTVTATVTGRIEGQSDILLLMSPKTAQALGVSQGTLGRVRVTEPSRPDAAAAQPGDQTLSRDPDLNPAASPATAEPTQVAQTPSADQTAAQQPPAGDQTSAAPSEETLPGATPAPAAPSTPQATTETPAVPAATPETPAAATPETPTPAAAADTATASPSAAPDDASVLSEAESRNPQKETFQPPREDPKFGYNPQTTPPPAGTTATQPSAAVASVSEPGATPPASPQSELPLADVAAPEESRPQEIVGTGTVVPGQTQAPEAALATPEVTPEGQVASTQPPVQTDVSGPQALPPAASATSVALTPPEAPSAAKPGSTTPATTATPATSGTQKPVTVASASVPKAGPGTFYLQLAAYGSEKGARDLAAKLAPTYPALVLAPSSPGGTTFKVVIGPLNRAESGTLLTWFRYRGFPDAFLKQE